MADQNLSKHRNREILHTFNTFLHNEASGGVLLLLCASVAVILASVPGGGSFNDFWSQSAGISFAGFSIEMSVREWINDALMAVFFFVVGLEIKREMLVGQLSSFKRSILPIMAAVGGMLVPALIYTAFNFGNPETSRGWGIPMATDIAFAVGILSVLGNRVPPGLKVFLLALAIVDDLGAIIVLALFYPVHAIHWGYLAGVAGIFVLLLLFNRMRLRQKVLYIVPGIIMWYLTYRSGIHATISGVLLAMTIPSRGFVNEVRFQTRIGYLLDKFRMAGESHVCVLASAEQQHIIHSIEREVNGVTPMMHQLESSLHPIVRFLIVPLFALANAGVAFSLEALGGGASTVSLGIFFGLLLGKPLGIFLFSFLSIKTGMASLPVGVTWKQIAAVGVLGGIGFTMSIFVNGLSFATPAITDIGKVSILLTSVTAAVLGLVAVMLSCPGKAVPLTAEQILPQNKNKVKPNI